MKKFDFVANLKKFLCISLAIMLIGVVCNFIFGTKLDISFKGGTQIRYSYDAAPDLDKMTELAKKNLGKDATLSFDEVNNTEIVSIKLPGEVSTEQKQALDKDLNKVDIRIDMKPGLTREQLEKRLLRDFEEKQRAQVGTVLDGLLPRAMTPIVAGIAGVAEDTPVNQVTREMRDKLIDTLKGIPVTAVGFRPVTEAIVTRGGVKIKEVNPSTMESKLCPGLYLAGEMLDVDGFTGGFNLQVAFSTGYCAGMSAAQE